jgi:ABC-2 type transport system ATP-binding protein
MESGATILLTTQYLEEADQLADRIAVIDHGIVIAEGTSNELKKKVGTDRAVLTFANESDLTAAEKIVSGAHADAAKMELVFAMDTVDMLTVALEKLKAAKLVATNLDVRKPTLDDVFLQLTGKPAEDTAEEADKNAKKAKKK